MKTYFKPAFLGDSYKSDYNKSVLSLNCFTKKRLCPILYSEAKKLSLIQYKARRQEMTIPNQNHDEKEEDKEMQEEGHTIAQEDSSTCCHRPTEELACSSENMDEHTVASIHHGEHPKNEHEVDQKLAEVLAEIQKLPDSEAKLQRAIDFMTASLAQTGSPNFKNFWEIRKHCLEFFKDNIPAASRAILWNKYSELSKEARRLKEILDEQSAFAVEQIEIAIVALEQEIQHTDQHVEKMAPIEFPLPTAPLRKQFEKYDLIQRELNLLNTYASRINMLRKELIKTEMRVRQKNKFFQRLSAAGDLVFPKRKELIKEVSSLFVKDVEDFIQSQCSDEIHDSLFNLREEIKCLQSIAKILTLNTHSFTQTRTLLSSCWDKVKGLEKDRKKVRAQQKAVFKENLDVFTGQLNALRESFEKNESSTQLAHTKLDEISNQMRKMELGRDEVKYLRAELNQIRKLIQEKEKIEEQDRQNQERERVRQKQEKVTHIKTAVDNLISQVENYDFERLSLERDELIQTIANTPMSKVEKQAFERQLKPLKDLITDKKEKSLLNLSDDDKQALQQLKSILQQRKERKVEIKNQIEIYRKAHGNSGFDIEQAMLYNEQMNLEKERLEKINLGIKEIEQKISELQKKV